MCNSPAQIAERIIDFHLYTKDVIGRQFHRLCEALKKLVKFDLPSL